MHTANRRLAIAALLASASFATPGFAQTTPPADSQAAPAPDESNDIVVTAQKREEKLQDVPISIQALGTKKLDQLNVTNFAEYAQLLPSVSFQALGGTPGTNVVYMRGVASGGDGNHSGSQPSAGVYLDEQPVTTIGGPLDVHIYDMARIESLAGPQGTLYGASSEAGTIRIITNKPDTTGFYGRADAELNSVHKGGVGGKLEGMVNLPLSQDVALRVVGFYEKDAGFIDNVAGCRSFLPEPTSNACTATHGGIAVNNAAFVKKDYNDTELWGGRAALKIDLDDHWTITPSVIYQDERSHGSYGFDPSLGDLKVQHFFPEYRRDRFIQAALTIEGKIGTWDMTYAGAYLDRKPDYQSSDYTDYAEAYDSLYHSVGGVAGYFYFTNAAGNPIDSRQRVIGTDHFKKMSQEFRVASPQGDRRFPGCCRVVLSTRDRAMTFTKIIRSAGLCDPALSVNGSPGTLWLTQQHRVDKDYAMFGEASYDILPNLTLTAGGRGFIYDNNSLIGFFGFGRNPGNGFSDSPPNRCGGPSERCRTHASRPRASDFMIVIPTPIAVRFRAASAGGRRRPVHRSGHLCRRSRSGASRGTGKARLHPQAESDLEANRTRAVLWHRSRGFRPELASIGRVFYPALCTADYLTNYEVGWKTTLFDGMLRFNGAIYQQEWKKFQFSFLRTE